jgi:hypothetical protein
MNVPLALVLPGAPVTQIQGILTFSFSNMKLLPRNNADIAITVGNRELLTGEKFSMYPNPAAEKVAFRFAEGQSGATLEIFNDCGQLVQSQKLSGEESEISVSNLVSGLYRVRIQSGKGEVLGMRNLAVVK